MFDLFGSELPLAARFFIAFLVVLALIGLTAWVVRRFGANRLGGAGARGRQPRLAVIDAATVDGRRRLVLIRRDNVEHLLMIGGPSDVVIEPNIVRAAAAREPARPEPGMRVGPGTETPWPLQPSTEPPQVAQPRPFRAPASEEPWTPPEPGARSRPAESLSGLAAELSTKLTPPESPEPSVELPEPRVAPPPAPAPSPAPVGRDRNLSDMAQQLEAALRRAPMVENRPPVTDPLAGQAHPQSAPVARVEPKIEPKSETRIDRRPEPKFDARPEAMPEPKPGLKVEPKAEPKSESKFEPKFEPKIPPRAEPRPAAAAPPKPEPKLQARPEIKPEPKPEAASDKNLYDNLEEEMASLLGRPSGKS